MSAGFVCEVVEKITQSQFSRKTALTKMEVFKLLEFLAFRSRSFHLIVSGKKVF